MRYNIFTFIYFMHCHNQERKKDDTEKINSYDLAF